MMDRTDIHLTWNMTGRGAAGEVAVAAAFHRVPAAADLCSCRSRFGPALSLRLQGVAFASKKRGTDGIQA